MDSITEFADLFNSFDVVDLSHTVENFVPRNVILPPMTVVKTNLIERDGFYQQVLTIPEHVGTHVDAPAHTCLQRKDETIDTFPPDILFSTAVVYHIDRLNPKAGQLINADQLLALEKDMGFGVSEGQTAILSYGWDKYWKLGKGWQDFANNCPGIDESAARLIDSRKVSCVASDTATCDFALLDGKQVAFSYGHDELFLPKGVFIIECLKNLTILPNKCFFMALPLKTKEGSGSPIRPIALVEKK